VLTSTGARQSPPETYSLSPALLAGSGFVLLLLDLEQWLGLSCSACSRCCSGGSRSPGSSCGGARTPIWT
jgi:hypothetical protein